MFMEILFTAILNTNIDWSKNIVSFMVLLPFSVAPTAVPLPSPQDREGTLSYMVLPGAPGQSTAVGTAVISGSRKMNIFCYI